MWQPAKRQRTLFEETRTIRVPSLQEEERRTVTRLLAEWMQELAKTIDAEGDDEQNQT